MNYAYQRKSFVFKSDFNHMYALNCMYFLFMYAKSLKNTFLNFSGTSNSESLRDKSKKDNSSHSLWKNKYLIIRVILLHKTVLRESAI